MHFNAYLDLIGIQSYIKNYQNECLYTCINNLKLLYSLYYSMKLHSELTSLSISCCLNVWTILVLLMYIVESIVCTLIWCRKKLEIPLHYRSSSVDVLDDKLVKCFQWQPVELWIQLFITITKDQYYISVYTENGVKM